MNASPLKIDTSTYAGNPDSGAAGLRTPRREQPLILVVDDDPMMRLITRDVLNQAGFVVEEAEDGAQGLDMIASLQPDLVILDVTMPGLNGFGACAKLRENPDTERLPVLMVTALNDLSSIERAFEVGATDFLTKPISPSLLPYRVRYLLKGSSTEVELRLAKKRSEEAYEMVADLSRTLEEKVEQRGAELVATQTELLDKERQLRQSQKMEALGQLAGGIAHEFNNQLTVIGGFGRAALTHVEKVERVTECLGEIISAADRAASLTGQMLAFSRNQVLSAEVVRVGNVINEIAKVVCSAVGETIEVEFEIDDREEWVEVDPTQLSQAIINLAVNARDAMPAGGRLRIGCSTVDINQPQRLSHHSGGLPAGHYVRLFVEDTGCGMDSTTMERIFDPFFTTKEVGKGTGLGLSVVFGIVEQCGGMIDVKSAPGEGTNFFIYFPVSQVEPAAAQTTIEVASMGLGETILVVEDGAAVLNLVQQTLDDLGYKVLTALDGVQAIKVLDDHADQVDLLITDVVMPRMGGIELGSRFSKICPDRKILYMSGYAPELSELLQQLGDDCQFLRKPFKPAELALMVRQTLDG